MTGTAIMLREECLSTFLVVSHNISLSNNCIVRSQLSIVLDVAPLEPIISLQHTVTKLSNHG